MDKKSHVILGIHITDRLQKAGEVQKLFSEYGHSIKTRLGLHHLEEGTGSGTRASSSSRWSGNYRKRNSKSPSQ